ncbi:MAG: hypothetical protein ACK559_09560, partial [bacterium]
CYEGYFHKFSGEFVTTLEPLSQRYPWVRLYFVSIQKQNLLTSLANNSVTQTNVSILRRHLRGAVSKILTIKCFAGCKTELETDIVLIH